MRCVALLSELGILWDNASDARYNCHETVEEIDINKGLSLVNFSTSKSSCTRSSYPFMEASSSLCHCDGFELGGALLDGFSAGGSGAVADISRGWLLGGHNVLPRMVGGG